MLKSISFSNFLDSPVHHRVGSDRKELPERDRIILHERLRLDYVLYDRAKEKFNKLYNIVRRNCTVEQKVMMETTPV